MTGETMISRALGFVARPRSTAAFGGGAIIARISVH
jgi:hypothetical protein